MIAAADASRNRLSRWEEWLESGREAPLLPAQRLVDPHHHLWDRGGHTYLIEEFRRDIAVNHVTSSVYVECLSKYREDGPAELRPAGETAFVAALADGGDSVQGVCRGIVAFADLSLGPYVAETLDAHTLAAPVRFKGVRYCTAWDADPAIHSSYPTRANMLLEPSVKAAAAELQRRHLSLDLWLYFHQLDEAHSLARACPDLPLVIDHCGGPIGIGGYATRRDEVFAAWRARLQAFRSLNNVYLKFGGLAMPLAGFGWKSRTMPPTSLQLAQAWRPYFEVCLDVFGPQRCMFESNFPVDRSGCGYTTLWNAFKRLSQSLAEHERCALFEQTAQRVYCL